MTGWVGGAVELPDNGCWLPADVGGSTVGFVFAGADGAVVVHRAVLHMIIRIKMINVLFKGITTFYSRERQLFKRLYSILYIAICLNIFKL